MKILVNIDNNNNNNNNNNGVKTSNTIIKGQNSLKVDINNPVDKSKNP